MTDNEAVSFLEVAVPKDATNAKVVAQAALRKAVLKFGRMPNVDWNREQETVTLASGTGSYRVGVDILTNYKQGWNIQEIWGTESQGQEIKMKSLDVFNDYKRGNDSTGTPIFAALYGKSKTLEFFPTPSSNFEIWVYLRQEVKQLSDIPDIYHDAVLDYGLLCIQALSNANVALALASGSFKDVEGDALLIWRGNVAGLDINMGRVSSVKNNDSQNLRGD